MDNRISWIRIIACFLVIVLHVSADTVATMGNGWFVANVLSSFSRVCVPLFFMVSGLTLLSKVETLNVFFRKRVTRIVIPLVFWSCVYLSWNNYNGVHTPSWIGSILSGPVMYHLWYLYVIIGLYALMPMMRRFYLNATQQEKIWGVALWFLVGSVWPAIVSIKGGSSCIVLLPTATADIYGLTIFGNAAGFFLLGAVLGEVSTKKSVGGILFLLGSILTCAAVYWQSNSAGHFCGAFYSYSSPFVVIAASGVFLMMMSLSKKPASLALTKIADCTLGIYCVHVVIFGGLFPRMGWSVAGDNVLITVLAISAATFVASFAVVYIIRLTRLGRFVS